MAGWDLFEFEMDKLNRKGGTVMFMGSSEKTLALDVRQAAVKYPNLKRRDVFAALQAGVQRRGQPRHH